MRTLFLIIFCFLTSLSFSQEFTLLKDSINPIVSDPAIAGNYFGTAWTDINNDKKLDLFYAGTIYENLGKGRFKISEGSSTIPIATALVSCSWADYENDGDLDLLYSRFSAPSTLETRIYSNDGSGQFTEISTLLNTINSATWSAQWCDYNNDSFVDFILTFADGFLGASSFPNRLFRGNADGTFTQVTTPYEFLTTKEAYTVSNWIDYDEDGDTDLFIASGPASGPEGIKSDFLFKNLIVETGQEGFQKLSSADLSFAEDLQDGQCYNAIDYDNDGDLDICLTNYSGTENKFYVNDSGTYVQTETPFTDTNDQNLSNIWGDFDNDGDLDVLITASSTTGSGYFINNGDGTFTESNDNLINSETLGSSTGATIGDYDNDGDLDFFVVGRGIKGLFRNDLNNKNNFVNITLVGSDSNRAALGARLEIVTRVKGKRVRQKREISASNSFMGHNSLRVHFGLGKAKNVDKLVIYWPSGNVTTYKNLRGNRFYTLTEQKNKERALPSGKKITIMSHPNPSKNLVKIDLAPDLRSNPVFVTLINGFGKKVLKKSFDTTEDIIMATSHLPRGNYFVTIHIEGETIVQRIILN